MKQDRIGKLGERFASDGVGGRDDGTGLSDQISGGGSERKSV